MCCSFSSLQPLTRGSSRTTIQLSTADNLQRSRRPITTATGPRPSHRQLRMVCGATFSSSATSSIRSSGSVAGLPAKLLIGSPRLGLHLRALWTQRSFDSYIPLMLYLQIDVITIPSRLQSSRCTHLHFVVRSVCV